jgi:hypothetical protein
MESHERTAIMTMSLFTLVLFWKMARRFQMPAQELALTRALAVFGLVGLVWTGVLGGRLMFSHAAGITTETLEAEIRNREAGHEHAPGEEHEPAPLPASGADTTKAAPHTHPPGTPPHNH